MFKKFIEAFQRTIHFAGQWIMETLTYKGFEKLCKACKEGDLETVRTLLKDPVININLKMNKDEGTPFHIACANGHQDIVALLLEDPRLKVNTIAQNGCTPFHSACANGHKSVVEILLNCPLIQVNQADWFHQTPLYMACANNHVDIVTLLLQQKQKAISVNKMAKDSEGNKVPFKALLQHKNHELIWQLMEHPGFDFNVVQNSAYSIRKGGNAMITAVVLGCIAHGKKDIIELYFPDSQKHQDVRIANYFQSRRIENGDPVLEEQMTTYFSAYPQKRSLSIQDIYTIVKHSPEPVLLSGVITVLMATIAMLHYSAPAKTQHVVPLPSASPDITSIVAVAAAATTALAAGATLAALAYHKCIQR